MDLIVNVSESWGIGYQGDQLVYIPTDLLGFRKLTIGKTVIFGRKTLATFPEGKPLAGRRNLVLSRTRSIPGAEVFPDLQSLKGVLSQMDSSQVMVIGGASVYRALLPCCRRAFVTKTYGDYPADTFFPDLDRHPDWRLSEESPITEDSGYLFQYRTYENTRPIPL